MVELFDPIEWFATNQKTSESMPVGDLFEYRDGYPAAPIILDTTPPLGDIVINESLESGGIKIHDFNIFSSENSKITVNRYIMQDSLGNNLYLVTEDDLGGATDETKYESIGYQDNRSLVALFDTPVSIKSIEIGATALKAKQYIIEVQQENKEEYIPILNLIASDKTRDFLEYNFTTNIERIVSVRIRYKGDYYAVTNTGNSLTLTASDKFSTFENAKISHFEDFSDASDFVYADEEGWVTLDKDVSTFDWELVNNNRLWIPITNADAGETEPINILLKLGNKLIALGDTKSFVVSYGDGQYGNLVLGYTFTGEHIKSAAIHNNRIYIGVESGKIFSSSNGVDYGSLQSELVIGNYPITSMASYNDILYIGTNRKDSIDESAIIYYWDESNIIQLNQISLHPIISAMTVAKGSLYVGASGDVNQHLGDIYKYDGHSWELSFATNNDGIDTLTYSPINSSLWAGLSGGKIYFASFTNLNEPQWNANPFFENDSNNFYDIISDPIKEEIINNSDYVWICCNNELIAYINTIKQRIDSDVIYEEIQLESIIWPISEESTDITSIAYFNDDVFGASVDGHIYKLDLSTIGTNIRNVYVLLKDSAGNITNLPNPEYYNYIYDNIVLDTDTDVVGNRISSGNIYQIAINNKQVVSLFTPIEQGALTGIDRQTRIYGDFISSPFYVPNLTSWDKISFLYNFPATSDPVDAGLDYGVSIELYVRTANTRDELNLMDWLQPYTVSTINDSHSAEASMIAEFNIGVLQGTWLQFYVVLTTASKNKTPELMNASIFYKASEASYFFSAMFDTSKQMAGYYNYIINSDFNTGLWPWVIGSGSNNIQFSTIIENNIRKGLITRIMDSPVDPSKDYIETDFSIDSIYFGETFLISFDYTSSSGFITDDMVLSLYNDTNSTNIPISGSGIITNLSETEFRAYFEAAISPEVDVHDYKLKFLLRDSSLDEFQIRINNVYVGPSHGLLDENPPKFRRGLLTSNTSVSQGKVIYAYTTVSDEGTFDFANNYTEIIPNRVFDLPIPSSKIRFGILFVTIMDSPVVVYDFAVQLECHDIDIRFMDFPEV